MNAFDIAVVVIISFCLVRGLFRGIVREAASIVGVLTGFYGAAVYYPRVALFLERVMENGTFRNIAAFFILFCVIMIVVNLLAVVIRYLLNIVFLGWLDRLLGMVFGVCKGILISAVILIGLTTFLPGQPDIITTSRLASPVAEISEVIATVASKDTRRVLKEKLEGIKEIWKSQKHAPRRA